MIGGMSGTEQIALTVKQYNEIYNGEIPDKIMRDFLNIYTMKTDIKDKVEKGEKSEKMEKTEEILS